MKRRRTYTRDFKISVIREVESGKTLAQVSRENEIQRIAVEFQTFSFLWIGVRRWSNSTPHATMHNLGS